ncbi:MAG: ATP-binding protein [bacterium]
MRFRVRLMLGFLLVVLPNGAAAWFIHHVVIERIESEYESRRVAIGEALTAEIEELARDVRARVEQASQDPSVRELLVEMNRGQVDERAAIERARPIAGRTGLAALKILDAGGRILSSAHRPASFGYRDALGLDLEKLGGDARVVREAFPNEDRAVLASARRVTLGSATVVIVGGKVVDAMLLDSIARRIGATHLEMSDDPRAAPSPGTVTRELDALAPEAHVLLRAELSRARIDELERDLFRVFAALGLGALALAVVLGGVLAASVTRPVELLAERARAVGRGERSGALELKASGELGELVAAFNGMVEGLRKAEAQIVQNERLAAWQEIARRMAHEIKNALFPIQLTVQTLSRLKRRADPQFESAFDDGSQTILDEVEGLKKLVGEFSRFARMPKPRPEPVDLAELANAVLTLVAKPHENVACEVRADPTTPQALCDREMARRVITNLVGNGVEALAGERGRIDITIAPATLDEEPAVRLEVRDTGPGIPAEGQVRLFEPYFTTKEKGTGLGLSIVHRIMTEHRGRVEAESSPGGGALFRVIFPAVGSAQARALLMDSAYTPAPV